MCGESEAGVNIMCKIKRINQHAGGFQSYSFPYKLDLMKEGPPQPSELPLLQTQRTVRRRNGKVDVFNLHFHARVYEQNPWMCGCPSIDGGLFCWPCVLFNDSKSVRTWKVNGFKDMNNLSGEISRHRKLTSHMEAVVAMANFGKVRIDTQLDKARSLQISQHNAKVKFHRCILKNVTNI
jgi:hypothetical protein